MVISPETREQVKASKTAREGDEDRGREGRRQQASMPENNEQ